jgi:photosystem II stability/assembly factor-like uncharacterized protein
LGVGGAPNGAAIVVTRNGGTTWKSQVIPTTVGYLSSISCRNTNECVAAGQTSGALGTQGVVLTTTDGGKVWTGTAPITGTTDVTALTCRPSGRCLAIANAASGAVAVVSDGPSAPWQVVGPLPPNIAAVTDVSCADDENCWVTGETAIDADHVAGAVLYTTDFGAQWTAVAVPPGTGLLNGLTCTMSSTSPGTLPYGSAAAPNGAPGSSSSTTSPVGAPPPAATSTTVLPAVTTTTLPGVPGFDCTVVGTTSTALDTARAGHGIILTTNTGGSAWTAQRVPPAAASFTDVSCPANGACVVVGTSIALAPEAGLVVLTGNGADSWKRAAVVPVPQPVAAVSCASLPYCVMAGESVSEALDPS